jgi:hypothetical protein
MIKKFLTTVVFVHIICLNISAQSKRGNVWITGYSGNKIDFSNNNIITSQGIYFPFKYFTGGNTCISDTNGNLILSS